MKYGTTEVNVPADGKPQPEPTASTPSPTTFTERMEPLGIVPRQSQMPEVMSPLGSSQMMLGSEKHQGNNHRVSLFPKGV
jgi:hypothetical protein